MWVQDEFGVNPDSVGLPWKKNCRAIVQQTIPCGCSSRPLGESGCDPAGLE